MQLGFPKAKMRGRGGRGVEKGKRMSRPESQSLNVTLLAMAKATKGQALHSAEFTWGRGGGQEAREEATVRGQVKDSGAAEEREDLRNL